MKSYAVCNKGKPRVFAISSMLTKLNLLNLIPVQFARVEFTNFLGWCS